MLGLIVAAWGCRRYVCSVADFLVVGRKMRKYLGLSFGTTVGIAVMVGLCWSRANSWGAYLAVAICMVIPIADLVGKQVYGDAYPLRGEQSGLLALLLSFAAFAICGVITARGRDRWVDFGQLIKVENERAAKEHAP